MRVRRSPLLQQAGPSLLSPCSAVGVFKCFFLDSSAFAIDDDLGAAAFAEDGTVFGVGPEGPSEGEVVEAAGGVHDALRALPAEMGHRSYSAIGGVSTSSVSEKTPVERSYT